MSLMVPSWTWLTGVSLSLCFLLFSHRVAQTPVDPSSGQSARRFAQEFDRLVGPHSPSPQFFESSFDDAVLAASTERRVLAVYLHSSLHPQSAAFCKLVLASRTVLGALSDVRVWGASVEGAEGYLAAGKVQAAAFPALVLISGQRIVDRMYGEASAERVASRIAAAKTFRAPAAQAPQQPQEETLERRRMMREQDEALARAMEDDARRMREAQARQAEEEAARRAEEEKAQKARQELESKRARIPQEPAPGDGPQANLRFQLPSGAKLARKFRAEHTVGQVREFLEVFLADNGGAKRFCLVNSYPKRTLEDDSETLSQAGLCPQSSLFVQDLDA
jgi:FAS-associated factor 2